MASNRPCHFRNPIMETSQDRWVVCEKGQYYWVESVVGEPNTIKLRQSRTLTDIGQAPQLVVWDAPPSGDRSQQLWAPELHHVQNRYCIYYAAAGTENVTHRMYVLESVSDDPLGPYQDKGKIFDPLTRV